MRWWRWWRWWRWRWWGGGEKKSRKLECVLETERKVLAKEEIDRWEEEIPETEREWW